jgi:hypothetical protein
MNLSFIHDYEKDIWCLLNFGKGSNNSETPTEAYLELVSIYGDSPTEINVSNFINTYLSEKNIDVEKHIADCQKSWLPISKTYEKRAETLFGVILPEKISVFLTVNNSYPYNIPENYFFGSFNATTIHRIIMHELWHFYTWYKFGKTEEKKLGAQKYNELKESLTVLLNVVYGDLLPQEMHDVGYPQHQKMRERILELWNESNDIEKLWERISLEF